MGFGGGTGRGKTGFFGREPVICVLVPFPTELGCPDTIAQLANAITAVRMCRFWMARENFMLMRMQIYSLSFLLIHANSFTQKEGRPPFSGRSSCEKGFLQNVQRLSPSPDLCRSAAHFIGNTDFLAVDHFSNNVIIGGVVDHVLVNIDRIRHTDAFGDSVG